MHLNVAFREPLVPDADPTGAGGTSRRMTPSSSAHRARRPGDTRRCRPDRAPSWSPATRRSPMRAGLLPREGGRCSPSRAPGTAPGRTRSPPTACCSTVSAADRAGRRRRPARRCPARSPGCWSATTSRSSAAARTGPRHRQAAPDAGGRPTAAGSTPAGCDAGRAAPQGRRGQCSTERADRARSSPGWWPRGAAGRPARRGSSARSATSTWPTRGSGPRLVLANRGAAGHRRHRLDGGRGRARHGGPALRAARRPDLPARRHRAGRRAGRAAARPDDRGQQRRRRRHLHVLEQGAAEHAAAFERVFGTPHGTDLAALCAATRTPTRGRTRRAGCGAALEPRGAGSGSSRCAPTAPGDGRWTSGCATRWRRRCAGDRRSAASPTTPTCTRPRQLFDDPPRPERPSVPARAGTPPVPRVRRRGARGMVTGVELTHPDKGTEMFLYELGASTRPHRNRGVGRALVGALAGWRASAAATACGCSPTTTTRPRSAPTPPRGASWSR